MGQDAVEINNKFLEVIRPIVARLTNIGAIQNRDYRTVWIFVFSFSFSYSFRLLYRLLANNYMNYHSFLLMFHRVRKKRRNYFSWRICKLHEY
jgi:hypothetical protein